MEEEELKVKKDDGVSTAKAALEKVTNMVGTFLIEDKESGPKKVASAVATFLSAAQDGFLIIRVTNYNC